MSSDPHFGFILSAYLVASIVVAGMIFAVLFDRWTLTRALKRLEAKTDALGDRNADDP